MNGYSLKKVGSPSLEELRNSPAYPKKEDYLKGPIPVIECIEEIPCNPCETSCPKGAIKVGKPITNLPIVDFDKCMGCGKCVAACPGLAIHIIDLTFSENDGLITFPYEYLPLPKINEKVTLVNRRGKEVCEGKVVRILNSKSNDCTVLITAAFPKEYYEQVVSMKRII